MTGQVMQREGLGCRCKRLPEPQDRKEQDAVGQAPLSTALEAVVKAMARYVPPVEMKIPTKPRKARGPRSRNRRAVNSEAPRRKSSAHRNVEAMLQRRTTRTSGGKATRASFANAGYEPQRAAMSDSAV